MSKMGATAPTTRAIKGLFTGQLCLTAALPGRSEQIHLVHG